MPHRCRTTRSSRTMPRAARWLLWASLAAGASGGAYAGDFSIGAGAGFDRGRVDCIASFPCDRSSTGFKLFGGYAINERVEVRLTLFDAGRFAGGDPIPPPVGGEFGGDFKVSGAGLSAGYRWPLAPGWSVAARAGVASVRTRFDYANPAWGSVSQSKVEPLLGAGLAYAVSPALSIGLEWDATRFKVYRTQGVLHLLGVSAQFSF